jgi:alpha-methylacyl-CoA racemase
VAEEEQGPLHGIVVLDLSAVGPGSRCTAALRDLGADVLKVGAPAAGGRLEPRAFAYGGGRGMRRIRVDLKSPEGRDVFLRLAASADVVVESFRPGVAARLGIDHEAVHAVNPRAVYCSVTGFGQDGPLAAVAGHDLDYLAVGGYLSTQGTGADGGPALPGASIADAAGGGLSAALSVAAALVGRERTGRGVFLDVATADGVLWLMSLFVDEYLATGVEAGPATTALTGRYAWNGVYRAADGKWVAVAAFEPAFFTNLCRELGLADLAAHQRDDERQGEIREAFRTVFATRTRDEWVELLAPLDTCVAPVLTVAEIARHPQFAGRSVFLEVDAADGASRQLGPVFAGSVRPVEPVRLPGPGTDTAEVLRERGFPDDDVERLVAAGVVE